MMLSLGLFVFLSFTSIIQYLLHIYRRGLDVGQLNGPEFCLRGKYKYKSKDQVFMELGIYWTGPMNTTILVPDVRIDVSTVLFLYVLHLTIMLIP